VIRKSLVSPGCRYRFLLVFAMHSGYTSCDPATVVAVGSDAFIGQIAMLRKSRFAFVALVLPTAVIDKGYLAYTEPTRGRAVMTAVYLVGCIGSIVIWRSERRGESSRLIKQ
jgi:hypothetical protein